MNWLFGGLIVFALGFFIYTRYFLRGHKQEMQVLRFVSLRRTNAAIINQAFRMKPQKSQTLLETFRELGYVSCEPEMHGDNLVSWYTITPRGRDLVGKLQWQTTPPYVDRT